MISVSIPISFVSDQFQTALQLLRMRMRGLGLTVGISYSGYILQLVYLTVGISYSVCVCVYYMGLNVCVHMCTVWA